jgi:hypothetical protein
MSRLASSGLRAQEEVKSKRAGLLGVALVLVALGTAVLGC